MVVLGEAVPVPLAESTRAATILPLAPQSLTLASPLDALRSDSSIFLKQRGAGGGQTDLVLRGGGFAQTLILVDGFRVNDGQTAHHSLDLPLPVEAIDSIEVLAGAGSTLHGADALAGVVDLRTAAPSHASLRLRAADGSFTSDEESLVGNAVLHRWSGRLAAARNFSEGFMADRDYRNETLSTEHWIGTRLGLTDVLLAASDRAFGANQFYGNYNSWERTKNWFAAARQELGSRTTASYAYRRHTDQFILLRGRPSYYENNHIDGSWQASLRRTATLGSGSLALFGLEAAGDSIHSSNLGQHARNRDAGYVDFDLHPARARWTLSAGAREEIFSGGLKSFAPQLAASFHAAPTLKLRAAAGYGFRIPTYTDLYYSDPTTVGNARLKPESAWSAEAGADWRPTAQLALTATGFYSRQHDAIDYIRTNASAKWQATNLSGLRFAGAEATLRWQPTQTQSVHLSWTMLHGAQRALNGLESEYVFNLPVENAQVAWRAALGHWAQLTNTVQIAQRYQQTPYPVWDATLAHDSGRLRPYLRLTNLANTGYQEIENVAMPGRAVMGGFALNFGK
jgi:iron complex outermembrane receptor protein